MAKKLSGPSYIKITKQTSIPDAITGGCTQILMGYVDRGMHKFKHLLASSSTLLTI